MNANQYKQYKDLVSYYLENDNREVNYQNRIIIPLLEEILGSEYDVVDVSQLTKEWNNRNICRDKFAGIHTPDILIAKNWKLKFEKDSTRAVEYLCLIEVKKPTANDSNHAALEINEYLSKGMPVILTDCITWKIFYKKENAISVDTISLEKEHEYQIRDNRYKMEEVYEPIIKEYLTDVCTGRKPREIKWVEADEMWNELRRRITESVMKVYEGV